jgi:hypothetical protein
VASWSDAVTANVERFLLENPFEGEGEHRAALSTAMDQILRGDPVDVNIGAASRDIMARAEAERQGFAVPKSANMAEISRLSEEAGLNTRLGELGRQLSTMPATEAMTSPSKQPGLSPPAPRLCLRPLSVPPSASDMKVSHRAEERGSQVPDKMTMRTRHQALRRATSWEGPHWAVFAQSRGIV